MVSLRALFTGSVRPEWLFEISNRVQSCVDLAPSRARHVLEGIFVEFPADGFTEIRFAEALRGKLNRVPERRNGAEATGEDVEMAEEILGTPTDFRVTDAAERAASLMRNRPADHWTLDRLAKSTGSNRTDMEIAFRRRWGYSVHTYLVMCRVDAAKGLLKTIAWRIEEVAKAVGYRSKVSLYQNFHLILAMTPDEYRRRWTTRELSRDMAQRLWRTVANGSSVERDDER
jgi:AraC-like DNA-binding protein